MIPIFITGIGTDIGKTVVSAIVANALGADYWKPIQAGFGDETDSEQLGRLVVNETSRVHPEVYRLKLAASPHIAASDEDIFINLDNIKNKQPAGDGYLVTEGAGGLLVPLNKDEFVIDLILKLAAKVILVSRNYLGSINHSLLTAEVCRYRKLDVAGWIFNDEFMNYQNDIANWSGYPVIGSVPRLKEITRETISVQSSLLKSSLLSQLKS